MSVFDGNPPRRNPEPWPADRVPKNNLERLIASAPMPPETAAQAKPVPAPTDLAQTGPLITVTYNDLVNLARRLIGEQLNDCDEEFMAGRAHGIGSLHAEILGLAKGAALAQVQDAPETAGAPETCRSSEKVQVRGYCADCNSWGGEHRPDCERRTERFSKGSTQSNAVPSPMCERKTAMLENEGYAKTGYVLRQPGKDREVVVCDGGAVSWFTLDQWNWLMFNRDHVEFQWPKPVAAVSTKGGARFAPPSTPHPMSAQMAEEALSTLLWLYRRLPRGYGRPPTVEGPILALAAQTGIDVRECLAERGPGEERPRAEAPAAQKSDQAACTLPEGQLVIHAVGAEIASDGESGLEPAGPANEGGRQ